MALTAPMPQTAKPNGDKRELHCTSERPACWQSVDICGRQDMHRLCSAEAVRKSSAVSYTHRQVGRQAGTTNLGPVKDGGTKAGLQAELVPVLLSDVSVELGEQVAGVHDRGGYRQARRALEFLAPGAAWLGQQPTHTHMHTGILWLSCVTGAGMYRISSGQQVGKRLCAVKRVQRQSMSCVMPRLVCTL